jgi:hypothetical protein
MAVTMTNGVFWDVTPRCSCDILTIQLCDVVHSATNNSEMSQNLISYIWAPRVGVGTSREISGVSNTTTCRYFVQPIDRRVTHCVTRLF